MKNGVKKLRLDTSKVRVLTEVELRRSTGGGIQILTRGCSPTDANCVVPTEGCPTHNTCVRL